MSQQENYYIPLKVNVYNFHFDRKFYFQKKGHAMPIRALCFSPDSQVLASASDDCHIRLHDM